MEVGMRDKKEETETGKKDRNRKLIRSNKER